MPQRYQEPGKAPRVVVIGAGIGGLTAGSLLARRGYRVTIFDQAWVPGGCASTFKRRGFTFDVGATQVAGLEPGGIHHQIFAELDVELPAATACDPACAVFLPGETTPINVWRDRVAWQQERQQQFPKSEPFWQLMEKLFEISWRFQMREPVLPPRQLWDLWQLIQAVRPDTTLTLPFVLLTVGDVLKLYGLYNDRRLRTFLDMQLKLYSQVSADETALLYAATALGVSQNPHGLYHLQGSMQALSDRLLEAFKRDGGKLYLGHRVESIQTQNERSVTVYHPKTKETWPEPADEIIANVTIQNLLQLVDVPAKAQAKNPMVRWQIQGDRQRVEKLPPASGAFVIYLGVDRRAIPENCPPHLQFLYDYNDPVGEKNTLFVSVSKPEDGRAPQGKATIIASAFTDTNLWWCDKKTYEARKQDYIENAIARLGEYFHLTPETILHQEAATPRTFERFTAREDGIVGGIGQRVSTFGPFGFANRTPIPHLWLVGDSTHPGEGTAGVSYSAMTVVRQIEALNNRD